MKQKILVITGPTGVGKTKLATEIFDNFNCELISADSMQVYKNCDIGTAKLGKDQLKNYPHYLIDVKEPYEEYSVAEFVETAKQLIGNIHASNKLPVIVGGTGLYIEALLFEYNFQSVNKNEDVRQKYLDLAQEKGNVFVYELLKEKNPDLAQKIHPNNLKRVIRALEITDSINSQEVISNNLNKKSLYDHCILFLTKDREMLYKTINERVDEMIADGLEVEARFIYDNYRDSQVAKAIGYKEFFPYFENEITFVQAVDLIKQHSRNYAKRQITWFKRYSDIMFINPKTDDIMGFLQKNYSEYLKEKL